MGNPTSDLTALFASGVTSLMLTVGEYEVHLWKNEDMTEWHAMACWFGDGDPLADASGATPAEALWNVAAPDGMSEPYSGRFADVPPRLRAFTDELWAAAVASVEAKDRAAKLAA